MLPIQRNGFASFRYKLNVRVDHSQQLFIMKDPNRSIKPVWGVEPNSMIVDPMPEARLQAGEVEIWGWAWSADGIDKSS